MKAFTCNKDGCELTDDTPPELEKLIDAWDAEIDERIRQRKERGCWDPESAVCDCPACGGFND